MNATLLTALEAKYRGKHIVIKYGGSIMTDEEAAASFIRNVVMLHNLGIGVILIHGGGPAINAMLHRVGIESKFIDGLRHTDEATIEIVQMVLCGQVNKDLSRLISLSGGKALGISGLDAGIITAEKKTGKADLGFVGRITTINTMPLLDILNAGYIPVLSTLGGDKAGNVYNINADTVAGEVAAALNASAFFLLTDVAGILRDKDDPESLIKAIDVPQAEQAIADGVIAGGMIPKTQCCINAVSHGVERAYIIDGRKKYLLLSILHRNDGGGTMFVRRLKP